MNLLSIETSGNTCGVCISDESGILADYSLYGTNQHDRMLAELVRRILADSELTIADIEAVAVSSGPGSFTGLRIGAALAKGLCFDNQPKLIAVPTLQALAYSAVEFAQRINASGIIAAMPSHKDLLYYQTFNNFAEPVTEIIVTDNQRFGEIDKNGYVLCGHGVAPDNALPFLRTLTVEKIAKLGFKKLLNKQFSDPQEFIPLYGQEFTPKTHQKSNGG